jgi:hypothetical protein
MEPGKPLYLSGLLFGLVLSLGLIAHPASAQAAETAEIFGKWQDQEGRTWVIQAGDSHTPASRTPELTPAQQIDAKQKRIDALKRSLVYVWVNPVTGRRVVQKRFQKLKEPFTYQGQEYSNPKAKEEIKRLDREIGQLQETQSRRSPGLPRLPAPTPDGRVQAVVVKAFRPDGSIENWPEARYSQGRLQARGIFDDIRDFQPRLPQKVKKQLLSWSAPRWIDLTLKTDPATGQSRLEGDRWALNVTYDGFSYRVKRIHTPYAKPLVLTRPLAGYRIVRIEVDTWKWKNRLSELQSDIARLEKELSWYTKDLQDADGKFKSLQKQKPPLASDLEKTIKAIASLESGLKTSQPLPDKTSKDLQGLLDAKAALEQQIEVLDDEIITLNEKRPPNWWEAIARKEKFRQDRVEQLQRVQHSIKQEYAKIGFQPAQKQKETQSRLARLRDHYWDLRKQQAKLDMELTLAASSIEYYQGNINPRQDLLTQLRQTLQELNAQDTPFVDQVAVFDDHRNEIGRWEAWAPFEAIQKINAETERLRKLLKKLGPLEKESRQNFQQAAQESSQALDLVSQAIMKSAYLQAAIESCDYFHEVGKGFSKGGPLGALTAAASKALSEATANYIMGESLIEASNPQALEAKVEQQYGFKPNLFSQIDTGMVKSSGVNALVEDVIFSSARKKVDQQITARVQEYLVNRATDQLIHNLEVININIPLSVLEKQAGKLKLYNEHLKNLKAAGPNKLKNFAKGFAKEFAKNVMKKWAKAMEDQAWVNYFEKDMLARMYFAAHQATALAYWDTYDRYMAWQWTRKELVQGYDPQSGFKQIKPAILQEGKTYGIALIFRQPRDLRETVRVGIREAGPQGAPALHKFNLQAIDLKPNHQKGDVVLKIEVGGGPAKAGMTSPPVYFKDQLVTGADLELQTSWPRSRRRLEKPQAGQGN